MLVEKAKPTIAELSNTAFIAKSLPKPRKLRAKVEAKLLPTFETKAPEFNPVDRYTMDEDDLAKLSEKYLETLTYINDQNKNETNNPYHTR